LLLIDKYERGVLTLVLNPYEQLLESIQVDIKKKGLQQILIANKMGVKASSLTYYLKSENKIKFIHYYELVRIVYESDHNTIINKLMQFIEVTPKRDNLIECLEWSSNHGEHELFEQALSIEQKLKYGNETAEVYSLLMDRNHKRLDPVSILEKVEKIKINGIKKLEIEVLLNILTLYVYLDLKKFNIITLLARSAFKMIEKLGNGFIKTAFTIRVQEMLAISLMRDGQVEESKKVASHLISSVDETIFPLPINSMLSLMSELNVFSDKEKSISYINKALTMFENLQLKNYINRRSMLRSTHDFVKIVNYQYHDLFLEDKSEEAHFLARTGYNQEALEVLKGLELNGELTPHQLYYKALATQDPSDYKKAEKEFYRRGDFYYCRLIEL
jgi:hypothetical protein